MSDPNLELLIDPYRNAMWIAAAREVTDAGWRSKGALLSQATAANRPTLSLPGNEGNLALRSTDITQAVWTTANGGTKDAATLFTFAGLNSTLLQQVSTVAGITYKLEFKARAVSGNTALKFYHNNSATGNTSNLTIDGVLTKYSVSVLGRTGNGLVDFGIRDENAAGHGQIEITEVSVRQSTWTDIYIPTTAARLYPGLNGREALVFDGTNDYLRNATPLARVSVGQPFTVAAVFKANSLPASQRLFANTINTNSRVEILTVSNVLRANVHNGSVSNGKESSTIATNTPYLVVVSYDGTNTLLRLNRVNQATSGSSTPNATAGITIGSNSGAISDYFNGTVLHLSAYSRADAALTSNLENYLLREYAR